jgi:hypothetical protein
MKVIIAGSRGITQLSHVNKAIRESGFDITTVVSGGARGVDALGELWAEQNSKTVVRFPADWEKYGKRAGYLRNEQMAGFADALIAVWDGTSKGTQHMINLAQKQGIKVHVEIVKPGTPVEGVTGDGV